MSALPAEDGWGEPRAQLRAVPQVVPRGRLVKCRGCGAKWTTDEYPDDICPPCEDRAAYYGAVRAGVAYGSRSRVLPDDYDGWWD